MIDIVTVLYKPGDLEKRLVAQIPSMTKTKHKLHVLDNSENKKNFSTAWNELASEGSYPYIAFLHSDLVLSNRWETPLLECLKKRPEVGAAVSNPARFDLTEKKFHLSDPPTDLEMEEWASWSKKNLKDSYVTYAVEVGDCPVFFCVMMRRRDFDALKGFDERFRFVGNNHEFQWRMHSLGLLTVMVKASSVWHKDAFSFRKAIASGAFNERKEGVHWDLWKGLIKSGLKKKWNELSDEERKRVRNDPSFLIGG